MNHWYHNVVFTDCERQDKIFVGTIKINSLYGEFHYSGVCFHIFYCNSAGLSNVVRYNGVFVIAGCHCNGFQLYEEHFLATHTKVVYFKCNPRTLSLQLRAYSDPFIFLLADDEPNCGQQETEEQGSGGLSPVAIAGICVACIIIVVLVLAALYWV